MNYTLQFRPEVEQDIAEAEAWYESKQPGLGLEFTRTVRDAFRDFPSDPSMFRLRNRKLGVRWFYTPRFPYRIVYKIEGDCVVVLAVMHAARHDRMWQKRAKL